MSSMLEKAIVDAAALREAAFNSAREALVEKYAPQIKEAVNSILEQEDELDFLGNDGMGMGDEGGAEMAAPDSLENVPLAATEGEKLCPCPESEDEIEIDFSELEKQMQAEEGGIARADLASDLGMEDSAPEQGMGEEEDEITDDMVMEAVLEAVSELTNESDQPAVAEEEVTEEAKAEKEVCEEEEVVEEVAEVTEESPQVKAEAVKLSPEYLQKIKSIKKAVLDKNKEKEDAMKQKGELQESMKAAIKNDAVPLRSNIMLSEHTKVVNDYKTLLTEATVLNEKIGELNSQLLESSNKNSQLAEMLSKINVDNAKLYYENQVLKSTSLNERQKGKLVEAIHRAGSVEQAKVVYDTYTNSMATVETKRPNSLNEVIHKRTAVLTKTNKETQKTIEPVVQRWKALAGIN